MVPRTHNSRLHRVIVDIVNEPRPFHRIPHPSIKPLPLPHRAFAATMLPNPLCGAPFGPLHDLTQRMDTARPRHEQRVPVVWHDRVVRNFHPPFSQQVELCDDCTRRAGTAQDAPAVAAIQILLHRPEVPTLHCRKLFGLRCDGLKIPVNLLQSGDDLAGNTIGTTHGHEVASFFHLQMRQVSTGESDGAPRKHAPLVAPISGWRNSGCLQMCEYRRSQTGATASPLTLPRTA